MNILQKILIQVGAIALSLLLGSLVIRIMGVSPLKAYKALYIGSLGNKNAIAETLVKTAPLILTGLAYAFAARAGLINIGAEGQLYMGGFASTFAAVYINVLPAPLHILVSIAAGFLGGALWGLFVGWLKVRFGANEIITTVMLNYVAIYFISFLVTGPMIEPSGNYPQSSHIPASATLPVLLPGTRLHLGIVIALLAVVFYYLFMWRMRVGYEIRVVGKNMEAGRYAGMRPERLMLLVMMMAGGMAGIAGGCEILGLQGRLIQNFSPGYGFDGIAVALVGMNSPIGIIIGAFLFGLLRAGGNMMQMMARVPVAVIYIIQGLVIVFVISGQMLRINRKGKIRSLLRQTEGAGAEEEAVCE